MPEPSVVRKVLARPVVAMAAHVLASRILLHYQLASGLCQARLIHSGHHLSYQQQIYRQPLKYQTYRLSPSTFRFVAQIRALLTVRVDLSQQFRQALTLTTILRPTWLVLRTTVVHQWRTLGVNPYPPWKVIPDCDDCTLTGILVLGVS
jgi:hypothetical protein